MTEQQKERLDKEEIRKALDAATPGVWKTDLWPRTDDIGIQQKGAITEYVAQMSGRNENKHADARLIANAPAWLRALLAENEQLAQITVEKTQGWGECEAQNQQLREESERAIGLAQQERAGRYALEEMRLDLKVQLERLKKQRDEWRTKFYEQQFLKTTYEHILQVSNQERNKHEKNALMNLGNMDLFKMIIDERELQITELRTELAAKDKALQMIANAKVHSCDSAYQLTQIAQQAIGVTHET